MDFIDAEFHLNLCRKLNFLLEDLKQLQSMVSSNSGHMAVLKMHMDIYDIFQKLSMFEVKNEKI